MAEKTASSGVGAGKTSAKALAGAVLSGRAASKGASLPAKQALAPSRAGKVYTVTLTSLSNKGSKTTVTSSPGKVFEATTTSAPGKFVTLDLSRRKLVGKHPEVKHLPAPKSKLKLDEKTRKLLLASMVLN